MHARRMSVPVALVTVVAVIGMAGAGLARVFAQQPASSAAAATTQADTTLMKSAMFAWETLTPTSTNVGARRNVVKAPSATLDEFESHITTLNVGQQSHAPHQHPNEEVIILKEGTCEAFINGAWTPMSTGSMVFFASNQLHALRNAGQTPATYYVINWASPGTLKKTAK